MIFRGLLVAALAAALGLVAPAFAESGSRQALVDGGKTSAVGKKEKASKPLAEKEKRQALREARRAKAEAAAARAEANAPAKKVKGKKQREAEKPIEVAAAPGNSGELRSEHNQEIGLFGGLFGVKPSMLPETRALDAALDDKQRTRKFKVKSDYEPQMVAFSGYQRGTIVIDTAGKYLYLVESHRSARRYAIAVGREGLAFTGEAKVGDKQEWPRWIPTLDMQKREPKKYGQYKDGMNGGPDNPLGARAIYLYQGRKDTHIRIHGTNQPETIGTASSNGCFRMVNEHVMDLYGRVRVGTNVVVINGLS